MRSFLSIPVDRFTIGLTVAFFVLNLTSVLCHAMWRDEWYVWLFVRNCPSLAAILHEIWHTGRPVGWYVLCWFVNLFGFYPWNLKVLHVLFSTGTIFLVARYSPFTRMQKALFALSYYPFYEFGTILRDYDAGLFFIILAVVIFTSRHNRPIAFGIVLALLFQINVFGILIGSALGVAYIFDLWWNRAAKGEKLPLRGILIGMAIAAISLALAYWVMQTPKDTKYLLGTFPATDLSARVYENIAHVWRACCPIPFESAWNTNFLDPWPMFEFALGLIFIIAAAGMLLLRPTAMVFYGVGIVAVIGFLCYLQLLANINQLRYQGHSFVVMFVAFWLTSHGREIQAGRILGWWPLLVWRRQQSAFLVAVLGIQVVATAMACSHEQVLPFSGSREAAEIILEKAPGLPIIGDCDYAASAVCGYVDRPIFIACRGEYSGILKVDAKRRGTPLPQQELFNAINSFMAMEKKDVVLLLNYALSLKTDDGQVELLGTVTRSMEGGERFVMYRIKYRKPQP